MSGRRHSQDEDGETKIIRFQSETPVEVQRAKYQATAKYDRKAVRKRLALEEWMHNQLKTLYNCKVLRHHAAPEQILCVTCAKRASTTVVLKNEDDEDYNVEIDIDILQEQEDTTKQKSMLKDLLKDAKADTEDFITELLKKIQALDDNKPTKVTTEEIML